MNQLLAQRIPSQLNIKINLGARRDVDIWTMAMVNTSEMRQTLPPQRRSSHLTPPANKHREQPSSANGPGQGWRSPNAKHIPRWCFSAAVDYRFTRQRYVYSCSQNGNNKKKKLKAVIVHCSCTLLYGCAHGAVCMRSYTIMPMAAAWHTEVQFVRKIFSRKLVVNLMLSVQPLPLLLLLLFIDIDEWCTV